MKTVHVKITGRVQGVFFRDSTRKQAEKLGVYGWVKNTEDGAVQAMFQGKNDQVQQLIDWCHQGPSAANVESVNVDDIDTDEQFSSFHIRY